MSCGCCAGTCEICIAMQSREPHELWMLRRSSEDLKREAKRKLRLAPPRQPGWEDLRRKRKRELGQAEAAEAAWVEKLKACRPRPPMPPKCVMDMEKEKHALRVHRPTPPRPLECVMETSPRCRCEEWAHLGWRCRCRF